MNIYDSLNTDAINSIVARWLSSNNAKVVNKKHESISPTSITKISNSFTRFENALNIVFTNIDNTNILQNFKLDAQKRIATENKLEKKSTLLQRPNGISGISSILQTTNELNSAIKQLGIVIQNSSFGGSNIGQSLSGLGEAALDEEIESKFTSSTSKLKTAGKSGLIGATIDFGFGLIQGKDVGHSAAHAAGAGAAIGGGGLIGGVISSLLLGPEAFPIGFEVGELVGGFFSSEAGNVTESAYDKVSGARAKGGPVRQNNTYLVGENGPELFTTDVSGKIIPLTNKQPIIKYNIIKVVPSQQKTENSFQFFKNLIQQDSDKIKVGSTVGRSGQTGTDGGSSFNLANLISNTIQGIKNLGGSLFGGSGGGSYEPGLNPNDAARMAMAYFTNQGWTKEQAAGIVGNLQTESGNFNQDVVNGRRKGDNGHAVGIAQWHEDRQAEFKAQYGIDLIGAPLQKQLEFVQYELTKGKYKSAGDSLRQAKNAEDAAFIVDKQYERSAGIATSLRQANARNLLSEQTLVQNSGNSLFSGGSGRITGSFGEARPGHVHGGIDIAAKMGTPVRAPLAGTIKFAGSASGFGTLLKLDHGDGTESWYGHMRAFAPNIKNGTKVSAGDILGEVGAGGDSTGPHLHLELHRGANRLDPTQLYINNKWIVGGNLTPLAKPKPRQAAPAPVGQISPWGTPISSKLQMPKNPKSVNYNVGEKYYSLTQTR